MEEEKKQSPWEKKIRILIQMLILSGAINIGLIITFFYSAIKDRQISSYHMTPVATDISDSKKELTNVNYISYLSSLSYRELIALLADKQLIEEGYAKRDLALGCLVAYHHFNIEKALDK